MAVATLKAILDSSQFKRGSNVVNTQLKKMKSGVISAESAFVGLTRKIGRFGDSLGANISVAAGFSSLVEATVQMQKYETTMTSFVGTLKGAKEELGYVLDTANKFGVSFAGIAAPFSKFAAAAEGFSKAEVHKVFEAFVTASSGLQLNMQEVNGVFLALQQIVSKGRISMEELRLQLAERVPGAMRLAAQAANMSMLDFEAAVRKGTINTREWLVDFAELIEEKFASAADVARFRLQASIMRLSNSFLVFRSRIMDVGESSESLVKLFDAVSKKFFQNEKVINALGGAIGNLASTVADWVSKIDDDKIAGFAEGLSELGNTIINEVGPAIGDFIAVLTDPAAWATLKDATINIVSLTTEIGKLVGKIISLPGNIIDIGLVGYMLFGKSGPGKVLAAMELVRRKMENMHPNMDMGIGSSDPFGSGNTARDLEAAFIKGGKEVIGGFDYNLPPIELDIPVEPSITFPEGWTGFEELEEWKARIETYLNEGKASFKVSSTIFDGMGDGMKIQEKAILASWSNIKGQMDDGSGEIFAAQEQTLTRLGTLYTDALGGPVTDAVQRFKSGLASLGDAIKSGASQDAINDLGDSMKFAAQKGIVEMTRMGKVVGQVINDISKMEKKLRDDILKYEDEIGKVRQTASDARFDLAQGDRSDKEQYYALVRRINDEFRKSNQLQEEAQGATGDAKLRILEASNTALERAFQLSQDLESTEENGISKAQAKADKLAAINGYERKSVENYKAMKKGAEDQLKAWDEIKKQYETLGETLTSLSDTLQEGINIELDTDSAAADIDVLKDKLDSLDFSGKFDQPKEDIEDIANAIGGVNSAWDDATRDMISMHANATRQVLSDLDTIERRAKAVFASAGANYNVNVPQYRMGGLHTGYGGGDQQVAAFERGEYTMPKEATSHYGTDFLDDIRSLKYPQTGETEVKVVPGSSGNSKRSKDTMTLAIQFPGNTPDVEVEATPIDIMNFKQGMSDYAKFSAQ